ncbi:MAG: SiaC family regulatory phosphoprotein [Bacteroidales bacterium]
MNQLTNLRIEQTYKTPRIELNPMNGDLFLNGRSMPENASKVYEPVLEWVKEYILQPRPVTNLRLNLEYFNTSSSLWISKILKALTNIQNPDYLLMVHLYISEEDFEDVQEFDDLKDAFSPVIDIFLNSTVSVGLKLYATNEKSEIVKDTLVLL